MLRLCSANGLEKELWKFSENRREFGTVPLQIDLTSRFSLLFVGLVAGFPNSIRKLVTVGRGSENGRPVELHFPVLSKTLAFWFSKRPRNWRHVQGWEALRLAIFSSFGQSESY